MKKHLATTTTLLLLLLTSQFALAAGGSVSVVVTNVGPAHVDVEIKGSDRDDRIDIFVEHGGCGSPELVIMGRDDRYGPGTTTVNGGPEVRVDLTTRGVRDLEVDLKFADDQVLIDLIGSEACEPIPIEGDLTIKTSRGHDTVILYRTVVGGDLSIDMGLHDDLVTLAKTVVDGETTLAMGSGANFVTTLLSTFNDHTDVTSEDDTDILSFLSSVFFTMNIDTGRGGEDFVGFGGVPEFVFDDEGALDGLGWDEDDLPPAGLPLLVRIALACFAYDDGFTPFVIFEAPTRTDRVDVRNWVDDDTILVENVVEIDILNLNMGKGDDDVLILPSFSSPIGDLNIIGSEPTEVFFETPELEFGDELGLFFSELTGRVGDYRALLQCFCLFED